MIFGRGLLVCVLLAFTVLVSTAVHAQVAGATLSGTVTDASSAPVSNANVSITNTATGVVRDVTTDSAGFYSAPNLLPGIYEITATAPGFSTYRQIDLTLTVGASQGLNISLQIGQVSEHIDVSSTAPDVQLTSSTISAEVNATTVRELPLNGRDWTQLATLQPGVISVRVEQGPSNRGNSGYGTLLTISGHQPFENNYRVDGLSINDYSNGSPGSTLGVNLGVDAIEEFSVLTSNYSAEYGRASGGVINAITKSGTNQFHGDAYWFLRSKRFDARNYFDTTLPPFHRNQFGASGGAPIIKNKTFIFADYEGIRQDKSDTFSNLVPTADARAGNLCMHPDGTCAPYHVNVDPKVVPYLGFWPLPNVKNPDGTTYIGTGDTGFYNISGLERLTENYVTVRGDHHFSDRDSLAASWFYDKAPLTQPDTLVDVLTENFTLRQMFSVEETHIFSPAFVNTARVGFNRVRALVTAPVSAINPLAKDLSLGALPGRYSPELVVPGIATMDGSLGVISEDVLTWNSYQFYDDAFLTRGTHSLKFGFAWEHMQDSEFSGAGANGSFSFGSLPDFLQNKPATVTLDDPTSTRPIYVHQTLFGGYLQDDWHWRSNLTFNIGLRYEPVTLPTEAHNTFAVLTTLTSPAETHVKTLWASNQTLRNFQPRLGFAWDPFKNGKTAVRGGFGIFDVLPLSWEYTHQSTGVLPYELAVGSSSLAQGSFPTGAVAQLPFTDPTTVGNRYIEQHPHRNYAMNWNLNIQRELGANVTAAIAYVGSRSVHSPFSTDDSNMVIPTLTSLGYLWPIPHMDPNPTGTNGHCFGTMNPPPCDWPRLNPNVGRIRATFWDNSSTYHGLQAGLAKRMSHGFQAQASYTWSKCIDMGSGSLLGDPYANSLSSLMFFNRSGRRGVCDFNITHNFVVNFLWQLPTPRFGGVVAKRVLGGWELGGIINASTGSPFTVGIGGDPLGQNSTDPKAFAARLTGPGCSNPVNPGSINNYLKLSCFSVPLVPASFAGMCVQAVDTGGNKIPGTCMNLFGNAGRNRVVGPGLFNFDFAAVKNTKIERISETFNVQFRAEFFNILNHPNFQAPLANRILFNADGTPVSGAGSIDTTSTSPRQIQLGLKVIW
jgi:hypothetical protein